ncbi:transcriptional regulator [Coemansia sp. RSA 552]|nr:transcriptional regulator [Coemansia sp. RSA 552]
MQQARTQDTWAGTPTEARNSLGYDRPTPLNSIGSTFGDGLQAHQFAQAQQQQQSAAAAYMQQQNLRQQQQGPLDPDQLPRPDISEFPTLGSPPGLTSMAAGGAAVQPNISQLYRTIAGARPDRLPPGQRPELTSDDFPALSGSTVNPGSIGGDGASGSADHPPARAIGAEQSTAAVANGLGTTSAYKPPTTHLAKVAGDAAGTQQPIGAADRFGMLGILTANDYGFDVSKFGLSLPSSGPLYPTFGTPWTDQSQTYGLIEPDFDLPACYNESRPPPAPTKMPSLTDETLFYVFYTMPRSELQLAASEELYRRQWRYHKELRLWLTKDPETQPTTRTSRGEQGVFIFFDPGVWQKVKKEFLVLYEFLEDHGALGTPVDATAVSGAQSVPPQLPQFPAGAMGTGSDQSSAATQAQLQNLLRLNGAAGSQQQRQQQQQQQQQQQLMMARQRENLQAMSRGVGAQTGFGNAMQAGSVALPPHAAEARPGAVSASQSQPSIAEDVAAASIA